MEGVHIGIPIIGDMGDEIFYSFVHLKKPPGSRLTKAKNLPADTARNQIAKQLEKDWLFFMDADQMFPPETIEHLLGWKLPIVSGLYFKAVGEPIPHAYRFSKYEDGQYLYYSLVEPVFEYLTRYSEEIKAGETAVCIPTRRTDLIECDGVGAGCLLVHKDVFKAIEEPYFLYSDGAFGGEDFYFCRKVKEAGFKIYLDPGVICGHKQKDMVGAKHFLYWATAKDDEEYPYPWGDKNITEEDKHG